MIGCLKFSSRRVKILLSFGSVMIFSGTTCTSSAQQLQYNTKDSLPYPFTPPSEEFCEHNQLGSDSYTSLFSPCVFTFYRGSSNVVQNGSFSCTGITNNDNNTNEKIISVQERKVENWPDSCVATGPRCYDLSKYPRLENFTLFGGEMDGDYYAMSFPHDANYVSVDCSKDYQLAKQVIDNLPEELEPLTHAIIFFGFMVLFGSLVCVCVCAVCICSGGTNRSRTGYTSIRGVYAGPPVEAREITV